METGCQGTGGREQELAASAVAEEAIQFRRVRDVAHASEVAEKGGTRLPYGRGSESARRVYSHLLSRDRQGAVVLVLFQQPLQRAAAAFVALYGQKPTPARMPALHAEACATSSLFG